MASREQPRRMVPGWWWWPRSCAQAAQSLVGRERAGDWEGSGQVDQEARTVPFGGRREVGLEPPEEPDSPAATGADSDKERQ